MKVPKTKGSSLKTIPGTQKIRFIKTLSEEKVVIANLSCNCVPCLEENPSECKYKVWQIKSTKLIKQIKQAANQAPTILSGEVQSNPSMNETQNLPEELLQSISEASILFNIKHNFGM